MNQQAQPSPKEHHFYVAIAKFLFHRGPVTLCRGNEANAAVTMLMVVPGDEVTYPASRCIQAFKAVFWPLRTVFQRPEQRLRIWIVVADPGPGSGWGDPQIIELGQ